MQPQALAGWATVLITLLAPGGGTAKQAGSATWTVRHAHTLGIPGSDDAGLGPMARLRIDANGSRIVVATGDPQRRLDWRLSIWTPGGTLHLATDSREIAEGLPVPSGLSPGIDGFRLRYSDRHVWYAYADARELQTLFPPAGFERFIPLAEGGFLGFGRVPGWFDGGGVTPAKRAIVHVRAVDDAWKPDTIGFLDIRHQGWYVELPPDPGQPRVRLEVTSVPQPFADHDLAVIDSETNSVVVVRRNLEPGTAALAELLAPGDTAWHRRVVLEVMPLAPERAEEIIEARFATMASDGFSWLTRPEARSVVRDAVYVPSYWPAVSRMVLTASREVWLKTLRQEDGMVVWHSIPRGDEDAPTRRVLMPVTFQLQDVLGDDVWGFSASDDGTRTAVALLLVPPTG